MYSSDLVINYWAEKLKQHPAPQKTSVWNKANVRPRLDRKSQYTVVGLDKPSSLRGLINLLKHTGSHPSGPPPPAGYGLWKGRHELKRKYPGDGFMIMPYLPSQYQCTT